MIQNHSDSPSAPLISAVVPAFNCADVLGEAISSLRAQTFRDIEILIVDDGSTDGTLRVARECAALDARVKIITREVASGKPSCARNAGVQAARGRYIALLDADDVAAPTRLESALKAIRMTGADIAFADFRRLFDDTGAIEQDTVLSQRGFLNRAKPYLKPHGDNVYSCTADFVGFMIAEYEALNTQTVVFSRALLMEDRAAFDEKLICGEDLDLFYRLAQRGTLAFVNEVQGFYRIRSRSLTRTAPMRTILDGAAVRLRHLRRLQPRISPQEERRARQRISESLSDAGYGTWTQGQLKAARRYYLQSLRLHPSKPAVAGLLKALVRRELLIAAVQSIRSVGARGRRSSSSATSSTERARLRST
jgi:GT2 family glycosyltransferase